MVNEIKENTEIKIGGELVKCAHCSGQGKSTNDCCQKKVGVKTTLFKSGYAPCCVCGGAGKVRV